MASQRSYSLKKIEDQVRDDVIKEYNGAFITDRYAAGLKAQRNRINDYWLNHAFITGHQWLYMNSKTNQLSEVRQDPRRTRAILNRMWPNCRTLIGKLTQKKLVWEVNADAADDPSLKGARLGETIIRQTARDHDWEHFRELLSWAVLEGGTAALSVSWDPLARRPTAYAADDGQGIDGGDTVEKVHNITQFVIEPGAKDAEAARWWIDIENHPPQTVQAMYGLDEEPAADATGGQGALMQELIATSAIQSRTSSGEEVPLTMVLTYWERPNPLAPEGRWSVVVDGQIVDGHNPEDGITKEWPFPWTDRLNLAIVRETLMTNEWAGQTIVSQARGVQVMFNGSWSYIIEHLKNAGNAKLAVPMSAMNLIEEYNDLPGGIIPYQDNMERPEYLAPAQMQGWAIDTPLNLAAQLDDIMGVHDISRGQAPTNVESGYGLSILAEQDSTPVGRISKEMASCFTKVSTMVLMLMESKVKVTRESGVALPGQSTIRMRWTGKDLNGQVHATVPLEKIIPKSKVEAQMFADKLVDRGQITTLAQYLKVAEITDAGDIMEAVDLDVFKAQQENADFQGGRKPVSRDFDNHEIHIKEHNNYRKTRRYMQSTLEEQRLVDLHVQGHEMMIVEGIGQRRALQAEDPALGAMPMGNETPLLPEDMLLEQEQLAGPGGPGGIPDPIALGPAPGPELGGGPPGGDPSIQGLPL